MLSRIFQLLLSLLTLIFFGWVVWKGYLLLSQEEKNLAADTQSLVIVLGGLAIVCTYMLNLAIRAAGREQGQASMNVQKKNIYEEFVFEYVKLLKEEEELEEATPYFHKLETTLLLQANSNVLQAYLQFKAGLAEQQIRHPETQEAFIALVLAMREDLSYSTGFFTKDAIKNLITT